MTTYFNALSNEEYDKLKDAISLITVYIAGADGNIDSEELEWAEKITSIRSYSTPDGLKEFYESVGLDFQERVDNYISTLADLDHRNSTAEQKLAALNPILAKLDPKIGARLYKSYITFAEHVAKASGGFLGFFSIGPEEKAVLDLKMIEPIIYTEEEDSTEDENE
ncbi:MAG: hypothetical protein AAGA77_19310 [Bacteroidota bacterium]